ncbi:MAG: TolC family protein [Polyangiaceae bacterium]
MSALFALASAAATEHALAGAGDEAPPPAAGSPSTTKRAYTLPEILALADENHPKIREARAELSFVRAQLDEAHWAPFSQFKMTGGVTLAPELTGSNVFSPNTDVSLTSSLGVAWKVQLEGVLPLWTFGKIGNLWDAAEANVKVHEAGVEKERDIVRLDVRRAFYAAQLAHDASALLADAKSQIDKAEKTLQAKIDKDEGDPIDLLKLQTFATELDVRAAEAEKFTTVALSGLRFYSGVEDLEIPPDPLRPPSHELQPISAYQAVADGARPELQQARAGLDARQSQTRLAESMFFPDIGIGLMLGLAAAPEIDDQLNPFTNDPANYFHYGAAVVFQWSLDFLPKVAKLREAKAQETEMTATVDFAERGVDTEIQLAYADVVQFQKQRDAYQRSVQTAKKWLIQVQQGIDVGTIEDKELLEPAKAYALGRFNVLNSTMELDFAMARLARASGWDAIAP